MKVAGGGRVRIRSNLIHGNKPVELIHGGVLDALGHYGAAQLLPAHDETEMLVIALSARQQHTLQKLKTGRRDRPVPDARVRDSVLNEGAVRGPNGTAANVGSVHGERGCYFDQGTLQFLRTKIASMAILLGERAEMHPKRYDLTSEQILQNSLLLGISQFREWCFQARVPRVYRLQLFEALRIDEQIVD